MLLISDEMGLTPSITGGKRRSEAALFAARVDAVVRPVAFD